MKQIEKLQAKARHRFGFCGSLIIHFILFVALAFSGVFAMQPPAADADTVVFFDAGGGGGGGGDEAVADAADDGEEQVEKVVEEETITLPDGKIEHKQVVKHVVKHVPAGEKKGSGSGSGGGHGTGHGTGSGSGVSALRPPAQSRRPALFLYQHHIALKSDKAFPFSPANKIICTTGIIA